MARSEVLLGIDGGWTSCAAALADTDGNLLARADGPSLAISGTPSRAAIETVRALIADVCLKASVSPDQIAHAALGINGVDYPDEWEAQHAGLCSGAGLAPQRTQLVNDAVIALWGATSAPRAAMIQFGSAYTSAYRQGPGQEALFDQFNVAQLYDVRREVVSKVARMIDGRLRRTSLADRLLQRLELQEADYAASIFRDPSLLLRSLFLADVVAEAWSAGDPVAAEMVSATAADLAVTMRAMADRLGPGAFTAGFGGGTLRRFPPPFPDLLRDEVLARCPEAMVQSPALPPEQGAVVMAAYHAGADWAAVFDRLEHAVAHA